MEVDYATIILIVIYCAILIVILAGIYNAIQGFKSFVDRNRKMDEKIDVILDKLENKEDN
ncbi:MAG: hypothetical protein ACREVX_14495 [Clostridium sp.]|uniref:hypothetical protein n=1 Tax=Clostridium sp. TaxID=1506 RepID=UPI003D6CF7E4